jgi:hypothetical protein
MRVRSVHLRGRIVQSAGRRCLPHQGLISLAPPRPQNHHAVSRGSEGNRRGDRALQHHPLAVPDASLVKGRRRSSGRRSSTIHLLMRQLEAGSSIPLGGSIAAAPVPSLTMEDCCLLAVAAAPVRDPTCNCSSPWFGYSGTCRVKADRACTVRGMRGSGTYIAV